MLKGLKLSGINTEIMQLAGPVYFSVGHVLTLCAAYLE